MIARICSIAALGIAVFTSNTGYCQQDSVEKQLDRVNQILGQIQNQTGAALPQIELGNGGSVNPFSRGASHVPATAVDAPSVTSSPGQTGSRADRPGVSIGPDTINIDVGGQTFSIPRTASPAGVYPEGNLARNTPSLSGGAVGDAIGAGLKKAMAYEKFARSMAEFKRGNFPESGRLMADAVGDLGLADPVLQHHSLVLFQNGKFAQSSAVAYDALRSSAPFDWPTIQSLYGDSRSYAAAYRSLQEAVRKDSDQVELRFLLGYHHLMLGHNQHASAEFSTVQSRLNNDPVVAALMRAAQVTPTPPPAPIGR